VERAFERAHDAYDSGRAVLAQDDVEDDRAGLRDGTLWPNVRHRDATDDPRRNHAWTDSRGHVVGDQLVQRFVREAEDDVDRRDRFDRDPVSSRRRKQPVADRQPCVVVEAEAESAHGTNDADLAWLVDMCVERHDPFEAAASSFVAMERRGEVLDHFRRNHWLAGRLDAVGPDVANCGGQTGVRGWSDPGLPPECLRDAWQAD